MITSEQIKELRDQTGVSMMQCKRALEEADGDMAKALEVLKSKSAEIALKKSDREAKDGLIALRSDSKKAILVSLKCETDFVARNEDFINLLDQIADLAWAEGVDKAQAEAQNLINPVVQKIGENIKLGQIRMIEGANLGLYLHNGKRAALVSLSGGSPELAKDLAMHIAAMSPESVDELLAQPFVKNPDITVGDLIKQAGADINVNQIFSHSVLEN